MTCVNCPPQIEKYGLSPVNTQWTLVRGDTATLRVEFWEADETTGYDTDGWTYSATAYDPVNEVTYDLAISANDNYVDITASPADTSEWGTGSASVVAELSFDVEVTIPGDDVIIWTPVIGTICVLGDVTGGSL